MYEQKCIWFRCQYKVQISLALCIFRLCLTPCTLSAARPYFALFSVFIHSPSALAFSLAGAKWQQRILRYGRYQTDLALLSAYDGMKNVCAVCVVAGYTTDSTQTDTKPRTANQKPVKSEARACRLVDKLSINSA